MMLLWSLFHMQLLLYRRFTWFRGYLSSSSPARSLLSVAGLRWPRLCATIPKIPSFGVLHPPLRSELLLPRLGHLSHQPAWLRLHLLPLLVPPSGSYPLPVWIFSIELPLCSCRSWLTQLHLCSC